MRLKIVAQNMALNPCRFNVWLYARTQDAFGKRGIEKVTELESPDPIEPQQLYTTEIDWPYTDYLPNQLIWKAKPGDTMIWNLLEILIDGKPMLEKAGMLQ